MSHRVADYIAERLKHLGALEVFMVTGGAAMHLNDAFASAFSGHIHCMHHEQSCAMAAESYARVTGVPAIVNITAGPGAINAINGVFGAFVDSIPMIIVSGQAKRETLASNYEIPSLRQLGDQEVNIVKMVSGICKYSITIQDPLEIGRIVDNAYLEATTGRPGPVWLDIPIDVQSSILPHEFSTLTYRPLEQREKFNILPDPIASHDEIVTIAQHLIGSRRPTLYVGSGIRHSDSYEEFLAFLEQWQIPTVTNWNSNDLLWDDHPCYSGRPGTVGNRAGNFSVQYSDCVVTVGARLNIRQLSYNWNCFAKNAWKCHVDIDRAELDKPTLRTDLKVHSTIKGFFPRLSAELTNQQISTDINPVLSRWQKWRTWLRLQLHTFDLYKKYQSSSITGVNPYRFIHQLTSIIESDACIVCADGTACVVGFQAAVIKPNQRLFHNSGCASMGYELPAAVGAFYATHKKIYCIAGDGSIMMNIQELSVIARFNLPITIYLLNNGGYHSIKQTQLSYFPENVIGCDLASGLSFPDFEKLAASFGLDYLHTSSEHNLTRDLTHSIQAAGPMLHEICLDPKQAFEPKVISKKLDDGTMVSSKLEDMFPFLDSDLMQRLAAEAMSI